MNLPLKLDLGPGSSAERVPNPTARARQLSSQLDLRFLGLPLLAFYEVKSTNDTLKELALAGAPEGLTVVAHVQTKGRGQRGRTWLSLPGLGSYVSVLLKADLSFSPVPWMAALAAVATAEALEEMGLHGVSLKWPNDVLVQGKKIAGVLVEPRMGGEKVQFTVIGIGINVGHQEHHFKKTGLEDATSCSIQGLDVSVDEVIRRLLGSLDQWYALIKEGKRDHLAKTWIRLCPERPLTRPQPLAPTP